MPTPLARAMRGFAPVARMARPYSEDRNSVRASVAAAATVPAATTFVTASPRPNHSKGVTTVACERSGTFGRPMMRRSTENRPIVVRMPARR